MSLSSLIYKRDHYSISFTRYGADISSEYILLPQKNLAHLPCSQHSSQACNLVSGVDLHPRETVLSQLPMHLSSWYKWIKWHLLYKPVSGDLVRMSHHSQSLITSWGTDTIKCLDLQSRRQTLDDSDACLLATKTRRRDAKGNHLRVVGLLPKSLHPQIPLPASKPSSALWLLSLPFLYPNPIKSQIVQIWNQSQEENSQLCSK